MKKDFRDRVLNDILKSLRENENYLVYTDIDGEEDSEWKMFKLKYPIINIIDHTHKLEIDDVYHTIENLYGKYIKSYNLVVNNNLITIRIKWDFKYILN